MNDDSIMESMIGNPITFAFLLFCFYFLLFCFYFLLLIFYQLFTDFVVLPFSFSLCFLHFLIVMSIVLSHSMNNTKNKV